MEPSEIILILAPILFPIAIELGIDPIHFGIIMVVNMEIGLITPRRFEAYLSLRPSPECHSAPPSEPPYRG